MSNPTSNFNWQMPTATDLVTDLPADFEVFGQAVDTSLADLKGGTTGQVLKKNSNTDMDFVWGTDGGMTNPMTTTGDTIYSSSGSTPARLGIGTANQVLRVNSGATAPEWATLTSGGVTLIAEQTASSSSAIDFNSIPGSYKNLILTYQGIYASTTASGFDLRFNNNSGTDYEQQYQYQETGSAPSLGNGEETYVGYAAFGVQHTSTTPKNTLRGSVKIYDYASSTKFKYYEAQYSYWSNNNSRINFWSVQGFYNDTTAITSLNVVRTSGAATLTNITNTSIRLYGES
jgi:hypothetical protein